MDYFNDSIRHSQTEAVGSTAPMVYLMDESYGHANIFVRYAQLCLDKTTPMLKATAPITYRILEVVLSVCFPYFGLLIERMYTLMTF